MGAGVAAAAHGVVGYLPGDEAAVAAEVCASLSFRLQASVAVSAGWRTGDSAHTESALAAVIFLPLQLHTTVATSSTAGAAPDEARPFWPPGGRESGAGWRQPASRAGGAGCGHHMLRAVLVERCRHTPPPRRQRRARRSPRLAS